MTSIQNFKTKLQPLHYPKKQLEGYDNDDDNFNALYSDYKQNLPYQNKEQPIIRKSLQSKLNKLSPNMLNSEGCLISSDDENVFIDLPKTNAFNRTSSDNLNQVNKEAPLAMKKLHMGLNSQQNEQKVFRPVLNHTFGASTTPTNIKFGENSKEEPMMLQKIEEGIHKDMLDNQKRKNIKYDSAVYSQDKENINNMSANLPSGGYISKPLVRNQSKKKDAQTPEGYGSRLQKSNMDILGGRYNEVSAERRYKAPSELSLPLTQNRMEGLRGMSDLSSEFYSRRNNRKEIYRNVIQDLPNLLTEPESHRSITSRPNGTDRAELIAFAVVEERLGSRYSEGLYELFLRYSATTGTKRNTMTLGKLLLFLKDFDMFEENITRESASLVFIKRIPEKFADFGSFVDVLYKLHKRSRSFSRENLSSHDISHSSGKDQIFQQYIQMVIFDKQDLMNLDYSKANHSKLNLTQIEMYGGDYSSLKVLEDHDVLLTKIFRSYWPWNTTYKGKTSDNRKGIMLLKQFREFCYDFGVVPTLFSLSEVLELFKKFQREEEDAIDYKGFIFILCFIANLGFSKGELQCKFDTFGKRLSKLCSFLVETSHIAPDRARKI